MTPTETRLALLRNGFAPLPLNGKRPPMEKWQKKTLTAAVEIEQWAKSFPTARNTGVLTQRAPAFDLDIMDERAVLAVEALARETFGEILVRIGQPPKRAILFRTDEPFSKLSKAFIAPDGSTHKIEILASGEQVVVDGIHPDTKRPYAWLNGSPIEIERARLPYVRREDAEQFLDRAAELLAREHGFKPASASKQNGAGPGDGGDRADWPELIGNILTGTDLHDSAARLAAAYIASGMDVRGAQRAIEALFLTSDTPRDERWKERFADIARACESAHAKFAREDQSRSGAVEPERIDVLDAGRDIGPPSRLPPRPLLIGTLLCRGNISILAGIGAVGKTCVYTLILLSLATKRELSGDYVFKRCRVLLLSFEDTIDELKRRVAAAVIRYSIPADALDGYFKFACVRRRTGKLVKMDAKGNIDDGELTAELRRLIDAYSLDAIAFDPFVKMHGLAENDNAVMDAVMSALSDLCMERDIAAGVIAHSPKGVQEPGNPDRVRGASAQRDAARMSHTLTTMSKEDADAMGVPDPERGSYVRLDRAKVNYGRGEPAAWFHLEGVALGNTDVDPDYPRGDEIQVAVRWYPPAAFDQVSDEQINAALDEIAAAQGRYSASGNATTRSVLPVIERCLNRTKAQAKEILRGWMKSGLLYVDDWFDPDRRETSPGLYVCAEKRPGGQNDLPF